MCVCARALGINLPISALDFRKSLSALFCLMKECVLCEGERASAVSRIFLLSSSETDGISPKSPIFNEKVNINGCFKAYKVAEEGLL